MRKRAKVSPSSSSPISLAGSLAVLALLVAGVGLSILLYHSSRERERVDLVAALQLRATESAELLQAKLSRSQEVLHSIVGLFESRGTVSRSEFRTFVAGALARQPEIQALGWTPRVADSQRQNQEAAARNDGWTGFRFNERDATGRTIPTSHRAEYYPVYYIEPFDGNSGAAGFSLDSDALRLETLKRACDTAAPAATPPMPLIQSANGELGFVVYVSMFRGDTALTEPNIEQRRRDLAGFASAVFRIDHLLKPSLSELGNEGFSIAVFDHSNGGVPLYDNGLAGSDFAGREVGASVPLNVAGRDWVLALHPTANYISLHATGRPHLILCVGLVITLLLSAFLYGGIQRAQAIERRVVERTVQLSAEVAERKRAVASLRLAEAKYRSIFENSVEGIFQTTPHGQYISANRALAEMYGYQSVAQLMSDLANIAHQLYVDPSRRDQFTQQILRDGEVTDFESQIYRRDGSTIWISENARTVRDESGSVLYYEGAVTDVTERRRVADELRRARAELEQRVEERTGELAASNAALQAEVAVRSRAEAAAAAASRAKGDFLANMSHEIRTPMNAILGYAQLLQRDPSLTESQRDAVETVLESGSHLLTLVNDILDISKIEAGASAVQPADFELCGVLRSICGMFRQKCHLKSLALRLDLPEVQSLPVQGDERKLRQVLINLLGNAVKFTDRGSITLRLRSDGDRMYRFEVVDTGIGIPLEAQAGIFEPFQQAPGGHARGGTGLGLTIAKRLVDLMGGELSLTSEPTHGTRFRFSLSLPTARQAVIAGAAPSLFASHTPVSPMMGRGIRALVVDDVRQNREVLAEMLSRIGCEVRTAGGGAEALALLAHATADIAFIDFLMPEMDGRETAARITDLYSTTGIKLVATSASALAHEQESYREAGFADVIAKPLQCDRVYLSLSTLLGIELESAEPPARSVTSDPAIEAAAASLAPELRTRLRAAAETYSVTDLKRCIAEIERIGPRAAALSHSLRRFIHRYDMDGVTRLLDAEPAETP